MNKEWFPKRKQIIPFLCCSVIAEIILFHGKKGLTQELFDAKWEHDEYPPSISYITKVIHAKHVKWYIRNHLAIEDQIWNGDFLAGLIACGQVDWWKKLFPTFRWTSNHELFELIQESPFYGELSEYNGRFYKWRNVPALYLKSSNESISYMAGVLATGRIAERKNEIYVDYNERILPYLEKMGIPIEYQSPSKLHNLISPIWPALFARYMPRSIEKKWMNIKHGGFKSELYASILWRMYISNDIKRRGIPYLNSRRWVYDHFGTVDKTEETWLKLGLSQLDMRIRNAVQSWVKTV